MSSDVLSRRAAWGAAVLLLAAGPALAAVREACLAALRRAG